MMTEGERLLHLIDILCGGNQSRFAKLTGINKTALNKLVRGTGDAIGLHLTEHYIAMICRAFPDVNPQFLRDGVTDVGIITIDDVRADYEKKLFEKDVLIAGLRKELDMQKRIIERLLNNAEKLQ